MLAYSEGRSARRWDGLVGAVAVLNAMVVFLYWRLYFADPESVTRDGELGAWWLEYYLHGLGPLLQWIDVIVIHRSFRRPLVSAGWLLGVCAAYPIWAELAVGPLNDSPRGAVTAGLPYPFLNDLAAPERAWFYATTAGTALAVLALCWLLMAGGRRAYSTARSARSPLR